ncbi:MAG: hypothetical protein NUV44_07420 [Candidatus Scalindua sp.]|nr:hypothetical protein [Candidatus Scalindua sp.]
MLKIKSTISHSGLRSHLPYITTLFVFVVIYVSRYWIKWNGIILGSWDEANWIPLALRWNDTTLFANDLTVNTLVKHFPPAYVFFLATGLKIFDSIRLLMLSGSSALLLLYCTGVYWFAWRLFEHRLAALIIAGISFRVNLDLGNAGWGIYIPHLMPRTIVCAITPWILGVTLQFQRNIFKIFAFGFAIGILGNIHPISALHLYLLVAGTVTIYPSYQDRFRHLLVISSGFAIGLCPYILQWVFHQDNIPLRLEILKFRVGDQFFPNWTCLIFNFLKSYSLPIAFGAIGFLFVSKETEKKKAKWIILMGLIAALLAFMGPLQSALLPRLAAIQLLRMSGYLFLFSLLLTGFFLRWLIQQKSIGLRLITILFSIFLVLTAGGGRFDELLLRLPLFSSKPTKGNILEADIEAPHIGFTDQNAMLDLCEWARNNTVSTDLFITPPGAWASFRIYAQRSLFVTYKDGVVIIFSGKSAEEWFKRFHERERIYQSGNVGEILHFAKINKIRYMIQEQNNPEIDLPIVYQNQSFRVLQLFRSKSIIKAK